MEGGWVGGRWVDKGGYVGRWRVGEWVGRGG